MKVGFFIYPTCLLLLCALSGLVYVLLQAFLTWKIRRYVPPVVSGPLPGVSVIVAAHNEAERLPGLLQALSSQQYPEFEVIIALDRCTDESPAAVQATGDPRIRGVVIAETPTGWTGKKWALNQAIREARHAHLAFTDADCTMGQNWLAQLAGMWSERTAVVIGLGAYTYAPGWLNRLIRWETFHTAFLMTGMAIAGLPYMAVGRNLAYRKDFFEKNGGFQAFKARLSGDDDLLVNAFARKGAVEVAFHPDSVTFSEPKTSWKSWVRQKLRHVSGSTAYTFRSKLSLALFHGSHVLFYLCLGINLFQQQTGWGVFTLYFLRMACSWMLFLSVRKKMPEKSMLAWFPVLDLMTLIYNLTLVPMGLIKTPKWN